MADDDIPFTEEEIANLEPPKKKDKEDASPRGANSEHGASVYPVPSSTGYTNTKLLRQGVDSLYLSFQGTLKEKYVHELDILKGFASSRHISESSKAQICLPPTVFKVHDKGMGFYKYVISNGDFHIQLSDRLASTIPFALVQIRSELLARIGPEEAIRRLLYLIEMVAEGFSAPKISRVDLFCDVVTDYDISKFTIADFVTRAAVSSTFTEKGAFSSINFGIGGAIGFRLYDKTLEISKRPNLYLPDLWKQAGWKEGETVWRFEFEVKRAALSKFDIIFREEMSRQWGELWNYLTHNWLRLVIPVGSRRERWPTHPLWLFLQSISGHDNFPLAKPKEAPEFEQHKKYICRYYKISLATLMADTGVDDIEDAHEELLLTYQTEVPDWAEDIRLAVAKKRREFSTRLNSTSSLTRLASSDEEDEGGDEDA